MYAGNIPINVKDPSRQLYYVFQPTVGAPVDEITIWLNGGPGNLTLQTFIGVANTSQAAVPWKAFFRRMAASSGVGACTTQKSIHILG